MPYSEDKLEIVYATQREEISYIVACFEKIPSHPVAPAGLYVDPLLAERFQLHRLLNHSGMVYCFETYDSTQSLPKSGEVYLYRSWWLPIALEAALDTTIRWEKKNYPDNGNHDHCLFTWDTLSAYTEHKEGYFSKYGWITSEAYRKFIQDDIYRLRKQRLFSGG